MSALPSSPLSKTAPHWADYWYSSHEVRTDAQGRFELVGLRAGAWWLAAAPPPEFLFVDLLCVQVPTGGVVIRLRRGVEVVVHVRDDAGRPYPGARVQAGRSRARSDQDGAARLVGLDPSARYILWVDAVSDLGPDLEDARFDDWVPAETTVRLGSGGR